MRKWLSVDQSIQAILDGCSATISCFDEVASTWTCQVTFKSVGNGVTTVAISDLDDSRFSRSVLDLIKNVASGACDEELDAEFAIISSVEKLDGAPFTTTPKYRSCQGNTSVPPPVVTSNAFGALSDDSDDGGGFYKYKGDPKRSKKRQTFLNRQVKTQHVRRSCSGVDDSAKSKPSPKICTVPEVPPVTSPHPHQTNHETTPVPTAVPTVPAAVPTAPAAAPTAPTVEPTSQQPTREAVTVPTVTAGTEFCCGKPLYIALDGPKTLDVKSVGHMQVEWCVGVVFARGKRHLQWKTNLLPTMLL